jgi:hypothetical protein
VAHLRSHPCAGVAAGRGFVDSNLPGKDGILLATQLTHASAAATPGFTSCKWGASLEDDYGDLDKKESVSQKIAFLGAWAF